MYSVWRGIGAYFRLWCGRTLGIGGYFMDEDARPVGPLVTGDAARRPDGRDLTGRAVRLERLDPLRHGPALWAGMAGQDRLWDYLFEDPPADQAAFTGYLQSCCARQDWTGYAICRPDGGAQGYAFYLAIRPDMGSVEVGNINFAPALQRSVAATEAMFLMMREVFGLGFRRYEWKCNALNRPSRRAAQRLGFSWEGVFRQHMIVKGRNRDTAWFAMTDQDWPAVRAGFAAWLDPANFDADGKQRRALSCLTAPARVASDPDSTRPDSAG